MLGKFARFLREEFEKTMGITEESLRRTAQNNTVQNRDVRKFRTIISEDDTSYDSTTKQEIITDTIFATQKREVPSTSSPDFISESHQNLLQSGESSIARPKIFQINKKKFTDKVKQLEACHSDTANKRKSQVSILIDIIKGLKHSRDNTMAAIRENIINIDFRHFLIDIAVRNPNHIVTTVVRELLSLCMVAEDFTTAVILNKKIPHFKELLDIVEKNINDNFAFKAFVTVAVKECNEDLTSILLKNFNNRNISNEIINNVINGDINLWSLKIRQVFMNHLVETIVKNPNFIEYFEQNLKEPQHEEFLLNLSFHTDNEQLVSVLQTKYTQEELAEKYEQLLIKLKDYGSTWSGSRQRHVHKNKAQNRQNMQKQCKSQLDQKLESITDLINRQMGENQVSEATTSSSKTSFTLSKSATSSNLLGLGYNYP